METSGLEKFISSVTIYNILNALFILAIAYIAAAAASILINWIG